MSAPRQTPGPLSCNISENYFVTLSKRFAIFCVYCLKGVCMTANLSSTMDLPMDPGLLQGTSSKARYVRFGPFCIDQQRQQVSRHGARLRLQGKVYQVLIALLQKQGEVVTRDELNQAWWPAETHVIYDANEKPTAIQL